MAENSNLTFELNLMAALGEGALVALSLVHKAPSAGKAFSPYGLVIYRTCLLSHPFTVHFP